MKRLLTFSAALLFAVGISGFLTTGCEEITNAATVKVPLTVDLYPESTNPSIPQTDVDCVDLTSNDDYNDNKDKIKDGDLKSASFQIDQLTGETFDRNTAVFSTVTFTLKFDEVYGDSKVYQLGTFNNVAMKTLLDGPMNIPVTADAKTAIELIARGRAMFCTECQYGPFTSGPGSATYLKGHLQLNIDFTAGL